VRTSVVVPYVCWPDVIHWTFRPHGLRRRPRRWSTRRRPHRCRGSDFRVDVETGTIYVVAELTSIRLRDGDRIDVLRGCLRSFAFPLTTSEQIGDIDELRAGGLTSIWSPRRVSRRTQRRR